MNLSSTGIHHIEAYGSTLFARILAAVATLSLHVLVARAVTPAEYGAIALLVTILAVLFLLLSFGNEALLVREGGFRSPRVASVTRYTFLFSLILVSALIAAGGLLERGLEIPALAYVLMVGLPVLPLQALQLPLRAELLYRQEFHRLARIDALSNSVAWLPAAGYFFLTQDIAALPLYLIVMHALRWFGYGRVVGFHFSAFRGRNIQLRAYLRGWRVFSINGSVYLTTTFDDIMIAMNLGAAMLGLYHLSYRVINITQEFFAGVMRTLSYPRYTRAAADRTKVYQLFCADTRFITAIILPILAATLMTADTLLPVLLGEAWTEAVFIFQLLTIEAMRQSLLALGGQAIIALGDERRLLRYSLVSAGVLLPTFFLLSLTTLDIFVIGFLAVNTLLNGYFLVIVRRSFARPLRPLFLAWLPGVTAALVVIIIPVAIMLLLPSSDILLFAAVFLSLLAVTAGYLLWTPDIPAYLAAATGWSRRGAGGAVMPLRVHVDGPYDEANPHLRSVYDLISQRATDVMFERLDFRSCLQSGLRRRFTGHKDDVHRQIIHMHYPMYLYEGRSLAHAIWRGLRNGIVLTLLRVLGYRFVLTLHDSGAHDFPFRRWERLYLTLLCQAADRVTTLSETGAKMLFVAFGRCHGTQVARHCLYEVPECSLSRRLRKRAELGIPDDAFVILLFGKVRPYKGFDTVLRVCADLGNDAPAVLCAGKGMDALVREHARAKPRTFVFDRYIGTEETAALMDAADFGILPYRRILHSGSAMLFASHCCPVIAPRLGVFTEHERKYDIGVYYDSSSVEGLKTALRFAREAGRESFASSFAAFHADHSCAEEAAVIERVYRELSGEKVFPEDPEATQKGRARRDRGA
ncbi:MAG: oligosaccharide flippase family protein [Bacteroidetes bacterium]|nr:oligosaccharide flippase family protein [Bacteroidota bacterium]